MVRGWGCRIARGPDGSRAGRSGKMAVLFKVAGNGGAPHVRVQGPGGVAFASPGGTGEPRHGRQVLARDPDVARAGGATSSSSGPPAGRWTITALPGSPRIVSGEGRRTAVRPGSSAAACPEAAAHASSATRLAAGPGDTVTFLEQGPAVGAELGRATKPTGTLPFSRRRTGREADDRGAGSAANGLLVRARDGGHVQGLQARSSSPRRASRVVARAGRVAARVVGSRQLVRAGTASRIVVQRRRHGAALLGAT